MDQETNISFSRDELVEITRQTIADLIVSDRLLQDLPQDITLEEINAQLALQHGQSMTIIVNKENGEKLPIVVSLHDLILVGKLFGLFQWPLRIKFVM